MERLERHGILWLALAIVTAIFPHALRAETAWKVLPSTSEYKQLIRGGDKFLVRQNDQLLCFRLDSFVVLTRTNPADFVVFERSGKDWDSSCRSDSAKPSMVISQIFVEYFFGMSGHLLFLDSGTGNMRGLLVYDVKEKALKHKTSYYDPIEISGRKVSFWKDYDKATPENCPKLFDRMQAVVEHRYLLNLDSWTEERTGEYRCMERE